MRAATVHAAMPPFAPPWAQDRLALTTASTPPAREPGPIGLLAHLQTLSPLVSNGRLTSDSGSMIPTERKDSRKLSPSTQYYDTDRNSVYDDLEGIRGLGLRALRP